MTSGHAPTNNNNKNNENKFFKGRNFSQIFFLT